MLFKKLFLFIVIFVAFEQLLSLLIVKRLPAFWGNNEIASKIDFIKKRPVTNAVFVGSSKVKTQIIPQVFDSTLNNGTFSFNLGCNGLFIPEAFNVVDYLLDSTNIKTIFFELRPVYHIYKENLHITRTLYYHTFSSYLKTICITWNSNLPLLRKINSYSTYSIAEIENLFNFNLAEGLINFENTRLDNSMWQYQYNLGFFPMGDGPGQPLLQSHTELTERTYIAQQYMNSHNLNIINFPLNHAYFKEITRIAAKAKERNRQLILVFPPGLRAFEYKEIIPLLKNLSYLPRLNMADPATYPELYQVENNFETDHLNSRGARLYSIDLANGYRKIQAGN